ncbi:MAG: hypothetical protein QOI54_1207 [Actinomycetota bacterium]|jgi:NAD(P)-dependent dehydrogenase (short-subunit alcohol dehydrogenase family)|nr:hypothetical protein [Actinomycetota bacterium]
MSVALVTGASRGLGLALAEALAARGWSLVLDARNARDLAAAVRRLSPEQVRVLPGDVTDPDHRASMRCATVELGGLDLLVNNASHLGPSPQPRLADYPLAELVRVYDVDVHAPLALLQSVLPDLVARQGALVNISSDAAVESYPGWGGYGSAKAALDQLTAVLALEEPGLGVYSFDPGDMRTAMHQQAFPGEDISDRPEPASVVPALLRLIEQRPPSGRYRATELLAASAAR